VCDSLPPMSLPWQRGEKLKAPYAHRWVMALFRDDKAEDGGWEKFSCYAGQLKVGSVTTLAPRPAIANSFVPPHACSTIALSLPRGGPRAVLKPYRRIR
jgi:hypothetical protein